MNTNRMTNSLIICVVYLYLGIRELTTAKKHYDNNEKKLAVASLIVGIIALVCAFLGAINF